MMYPPRQTLLELWTAIVAHNVAATGSVFGAVGEPDSIRDAERLVCLLYPAFRVPGLRFATPDATEGDVLAALARLGDHIGIPDAFVEALEAYEAVHCDPDGTPRFRSGDRFHPLAVAGSPAPTLSGLELETVEAYSIAVTLTLSALAFVKNYRSGLRGAAARDRLSALEQALSDRLSAAMRGLLESFTVDSFAADSRKGELLAQTLSVSGLPGGRALSELNRLLQPIRAGLLELAPAHEGVDRLEDESVHFQCGWSWGRITGSASRTPSLYFTVVAMDGIVDFFSVQTRRLGLLGPEQQALAHTLRQRWELTQSFWTTLARFGSRSMPLADPPWRILSEVGEPPSDYSTLQVASIVVHNLMRHRGVDDVRPAEDLTALANVLDDLASRAKITRRAEPDDRAVRLHSPGILMPLEGSTSAAPSVGWFARDFAPMLHKRMLQVAALTPSMELRDRLMNSADELFEHLWQRRLAGPAAVGLWDDPAAVFGAQAGESGERPCWYLTERMVEVLVVAATTAEAGPARSPGLGAHAVDLLREAEHLLDQETMRQPASGTQAMEHIVRIDALLRRARAVSADRPGVSSALALQAILELDGLALARELAEKSW